MKTKYITIMSILMMAYIMPLYSSAETLTKKVEKPNIIWIVLEDVSNDLGAYGNSIVNTPNLDKLAGQGIKFNNAYATSPVCSPSRSAFFTGMYQTSIGAQNHRSHQHDGFKLPEQVKMVTEYLRDAGYYSILMGPKQKLDFNFSPNVPPFDSYDGKFKAPNGAYSHGPINESILNKPAWKKYKKEGQGKPFFAQINYSEAHRTFIHDPENPISADEVKVPSYYPNHEITRVDWKLYLETIQWLDKKIGVLFQELEDANALDNTVIFVFGDHGRAMLRAKQWLYDSGLQVPLLVFGKGIKPLQTSDELVSLIDIMPTTLKLAGIEVPSYIEGNVFLGKDKETRQYIYAQRDRLGATEDRIRAIRDDRYKYILNYYPNLPYSNFSTYKKLQYPVLTLMEVLKDKNELTKQQLSWFQSPRPVQELYDTYTDPEEVNNLANDIRYKQRLNDMHNKLTHWVTESKDQGVFLEDPIISYNLDISEAKRYKEVMESRGLSATISNEDYLKWWDSRLKQLIDIR